MKLVRFVVLARQAGVHVLRLSHPTLVRPVKLDGKAVPDSVIEAVWGFFAVCVFTFLVLLSAGLWRG